MKSILFIVILFVGITIVSFGIGVVQIIQEHAFLASAETATGTVTRSQVDSAGNSVVFCPIVEFTTKAGKPAAYESDLCKNHPDQVKIGQEVQVYYDPQNPKNVQRKDSNLLIQYGDMAGFPFLFGILFMGITLLMIVMSWFAARRLRLQKAARAAVPDKSAPWDEYVSQKNEQTLRELEARRRQQGQVNPPGGETDASLSAETERLKAQSARLRAQTEELQKKIEERRRNKGQ